MATAKQRATMGILACYIRGMDEYHTNNPPTIHDQWSAWTDELTEFVEAVMHLDAPESYKESMDSLHSFLRLVLFLVSSIPLVGRWLHAFISWLPLLAWPTAKKHALRWQKHGCIRSERNCAKDPPGHVCNRRR